MASNHGDFCLNCHAAWPCGCASPAWGCGICGGDQHECRCDERGNEEETHVPIVADEGE